MDWSHSLLPDGTKNPYAIEWEKYTISKSGNPPLYQAWYKRESLAVVDTSKEAKKVCLDHHEKEHPAIKAMREKLKT